MSVNQSQNQNQTPNQPDSHSNRLNLFKFGSKRKSFAKDVVKTCSNEEDQDPINQSSDYLNLNTPHNDSIDEDEDDGNIKSYPSSFSYDIQTGSQTHLQSPISPSESSLIFERSVEDPTQIYQQPPNACSRCQTNNDDNTIGNSPNLKCNHQSVCNLPSHFSMENFVSPCLDATTKILTDENTNLDNVDMVYSRRPSSVLGLNLALGRAKSFSANTFNNDDTPIGFSPSSRKNSNLNIAKTNSLANMRDFDNGTTPKRPPTLSFYSYADLINNEHPNPKRPSISQSLSSSFINQRQASRSNSIIASAAQQQRENVLNNSSIGNSSITPRRNSRMNSRSSFSNPFNLNSSMTITSSKKKFHLTPDSPTSSDSECEYNPNQNIRTNLRLKRNSTCSNNGKLNKTYSNQSSIISSNHPHGLTSPNSNISSTNSFKDRRYSNIDDNLYNSSDNESLVVSSIGDQLRRNNGEIHSTNNSIIA